MKKYIISVIILSAIIFSVLRWNYFKADNKKVVCSDSNLLNLKVTIIASKIEKPGATQPINKLPEHILNNSCFPKELYELYTTQVLPTRECFEQNVQKTQQWQDNWMGCGEGQRSRGGTCPEEETFQRSLPRCDDKIFYQFDTKVHEFLQENLPNY